MAINTPLNPERHVNPREDLRIRAGYFGLLMRRRRSYLSERIIRSGEEMDSNSQAGETVGDDGEEEMLERLKSDGLYKWVSALIELGLVNLGCDPFAVYKLEKGKGDLASGLKEYDNSRRLFGKLCDELRRKWSKVILVTVVYMCAKSMSVMAFRSLIEMTDYYGLADAHECIKRIAWYVGDPYSSLSQLGVLAYMGSPFACVMARCVLAYDFTHNRPLDSCFVRFVLDPKQEMHRIDTNVGKHLEQAVEEVAKYRQDLLGAIQMYQRFEPTLTNHDDPVVQSTLAGWQRNLDRASNQLKWLKLLRSQTNVITPKAFSLSSHRSYCLWFLAGYSLLGLGSSITVLLGQIVAIYVNCVSRCEETVAARRIYQLEAGIANASNPSYCSLFGPFTWPELFTLVEINILAQVNLSLTWIYLIAIHLLQVMQTLDLTSNISSELDRALTEMREFDNSPANELRDEQLGKIDCLLYTNIISLFIHERELSASTHFMQIVMSLSVLNVAAFTVTLFSVLGSNSVTARKTSGRSVLQPVRSIAGYEINIDTSITAIIWMFVWLVVICVVLPVASIPSRVCRMKRTIYSVMAEIRRLQSTMQPRKLTLQHRQASQQVLKDVCGPSDLSENDPLARLWRKFVFSRSFATDHHTASVFDISINYRNIIELNLSVTTIISVLTARG